MRSVKAIFGASYDREGEVVLADGHTSTIFLQQLSTALLIHPKTVTMSRLC